MAVMRIDGLQKAYGQVRAVQDLSLAVEAGDLYGLLGPNGSGKTTTLACALGLRCEFFMKNRKRAPQKQREKTERSSRCAPTGTSG